MRKQSCQIKALIGSISKTVQVVNLQYSNPIFNPEIILLTLHLNSYEKRRRLVKQ